MKRNIPGKSLSHRLFILFIILLLPTFFIREYRLIKSKKDTRIIQTEDFSFSEIEPEEDKSFTFIVLTNNNVSSIDENIKSILSQNYSDFRIVYIDQGSTDGTLEHIREVIKEGEKKISLIECQLECEVYKKYYTFISNMRDEEVVIHLYGTDWLAHEDVAARLSQNYTNPDVWLTYGQYLDYSSFQKGMNDPKPKKTLCKKRVQKAPWVTAPLKTFYAGLFKKLNIEEGFFLSIKDENALLIPMAELAKAHVRFIPDVLYIHSEKIENRIKNRRVAFMESHKKGAIKKIEGEKEVDLILFSENSPEDLHKCLSSCAKHLQGITSVHVIYQSSEENAAAYEKVKNEHQDVHFNLSISSPLGFKQTILESLWKNAHSSPYVLLSTDQVEISNQISLPVCIAAMQKAHAYGFYFHLGRKGGNSEDEGIYSWNIRRSEGSFKTPDALLMGLYSRLNLEQELKKLSFNSIHDLVEAWAEESTKYRVGLFFREPRVSRVPVEMPKQS